MRSLLIVLAVVGVAVAKPGYLGLGLGLHAPLAAPLAYSTIAAPAPVVHSVVAPAALSSQYHAQDELGQYSYGYAGGPSAKSEVKTFDGVTRGGYSYVDAEGKLQSVNYVADAVNGFRVAATNLPKAVEPIPAEPLVAPEPVQDTAEVAAAKAAHFAAHVEAKAAAEAAPAAVESVAIEPAAVTIARSDLLPASVLSRTIVSPIAAPAIIPAVAPLSRFAYSSVAAAPLTIW